MGCKGLRTDLISSCVNTTADNISMPYNSRPFYVKSHLEFKKNLNCNSTEARRTQLNYSKYNGTDRVHP